MNTNQLSDIYLSVNYLGEPGKAYYFAENDADIVNKWGELKRKELEYELNARVPSKRLELEIKVGFPPIGLANEFFDSQESIISTIISEGSYCSSWHAGYTRMFYMM
jgi:hypothetical protein